MNRLTFSLLALSIAAAAYPCGCVGQDGSNIQFASQKNVIV